MPGREPLIIVSEKFKLRAKRERFLIITPGGRAERAALRTLYIAILARRGWVSSAAMCLAARHGVPIFVIRRSAIIPILSARPQLSSEAAKGYGECWRIVSLALELRHAMMHNLETLCKLTGKQLADHDQLYEAVSPDAPERGREALGLLLRLLECEYFAALVRRGLDPFAGAIPGARLYVELALVLWPLAAWELIKEGVPEDRRALAELHQRLMSSDVYDARLKTTIRLREVVHRDAAALLSCLRGSPMGFRAFRWTPR